MTTILPAAPTATHASVLLARMTLEEKLAQLVGYWVDEGGAMVAPMQGGDGATAPTLREFAAHGLGQLTRVYGTRPVDPTERAAWLREHQRWLQTETRLGIPAIVHEECLTGLAAWKATSFPTALAWGAAFDPDLVREMGAAIGSTMALLGVHQGLAPVLDVVRDVRWGRVEECIGEDPYLVGTVGTAYVQGLQSAGIIATLKHFVGYSASRAGRNLAPVSAGPRELADVLLPPFEMAVLDGGARSIMHSYAEIDGMPVAADAALLTGLLRDRWHFEGTVVADYFGVAFLRDLHQIAETLGDAACLALRAGIDVELPTGDAYLAPLACAVRAGTVDEALVDRAVLRVLTQKAELGLFDATFDDHDGSPDLDLDPPAHRALAARLAERSVVLVANDGILPLPTLSRVAVIGPNAHRSSALFGAYAFVNHVLDQYPGHDLGISAPTVLEAMRAEPFDVSYVQGCDVESRDRSEFAAATAAAAAADVAVIVVGDQAGLFGRGTSGEGCDRDDLELPGVQRPLVEAVLDTGTPVVLVLVTGRPYAIGWAMSRCAAVVQAFFPGEEGASAIAGILSGRINPSGHLPVTLPRSAGSQPFSYLHPSLGAPSKVSNVDTTPVAHLGHGLSYTTFAYTDLAVPLFVRAGRSFEASVTVTNTGERAGDDVIQLYARDVVASVTRPLAQLVAYQRVALEPHASARVTFWVPSTRFAFSNIDLVRVVEPGVVDLWVGTSCAVRSIETRLELTGAVHRVTTADDRIVTATIRPLSTEQVPKVAELEPRAPDPTT